MSVVTREVGRAELKVGHVLVSKADPSRTFIVTRIAAGFNGYDWPYLYMTGPGGVTVGHDTSFDAPSATYTVRSPQDDPDV